jgi:hypothetical protein
MTVDELREELKDIDGDQSVSIEMNGVEFGDSFYFEGPIWIDGKITKIGVCERGVVISALMVED